MNKKRYGNELEMRQGTVEAKRRISNRHDTIRNAFQTATTGSDPCRLFKLIEKLLAGDKGTELPLDAADPCPDFLRILHSIDLETVGLSFELDLQSVVGLH